MKRSMRAALVTAGAALTISVAAMTEPAPGVLAQAVPSPSPSPIAPVAAPAGSPVASPTTTTPPRAGGFPLELAWPMVAGGAAAVGAGALLLRRGKR